MILANLSDEELIREYSNGNVDAMEYLCTKYKPLVLKLSKPLFIIGAESDDLIQEGMLGLFKAIQDYKDDKAASFYTFASICIQRQMLKAVEASGRQKNQPLNLYVSLSPDEDGEVDSILSQSASDSDIGLDPEAQVIAKEEIGSRIARVEALLSPMEKEVFRAFMAGDDYHAIAIKMNKSEKAIDNALTRIRLKAIGLHSQM